MSKEKDIYQQIWTVLQSSTFDFCKRRTRAFVPSGSEENLYPKQYPWIFVDRYRQSAYEAVYMPKIYRHETTYAVTAVTYADKGGFADLLYNIDSVNANQGILDIADLIRDTFAAGLHNGFFGVGINRWTFRGITDPTHPKVARLINESYLLDGIQIVMTFEIDEELG